MDPQQTWNDLLTTWQDRDWDSVLELAEALTDWLIVRNLCWMTRGKFHVMSPFHSVVAFATTLDRPAIWPPVPMAGAQFSTSLPEYLKIFAVRVPIATAERSAATSRVSFLRFYTFLEKGNPMASKPKARPVHEVRMGRVKAAIWENDTQNGMRHNVTVSRLYKDGEQWKDSTSFGRDDLPLVSKVVDLAHTWIFDNGNGSNHESSE